jgi:antitoxin (DNA-binding transcriptional repressor) of toxin-antitoxin stability system
MVKVALEEATTRLSDLIEAAVNGEAVYITTDEQMIRLVPETVIKVPRQFGSAKGLIHMADDFDAPLEDFREYME